MGCDCNSRRFSFDFFCRSNGTRARKRAERITAASREVYAACGFSGVLQPRKGRCNYIWSRWQWEEASRENIAKGSGSVGAAAVRDETIVLYPRVSSLKRQHRVCASVLYHIASHGAADPTLLSDQLESAATR